MDGVQDSSVVPGAPPGTCEDSPTAIEIVIPLARRETKKWVIVAPRVPWYTSCLVVT